MLLAEMVFLLNGMAGYNQKGNCETRLKKNTKQRDTKAALFSSPLGQQALTGRKNVRQITWTENVPRRVFLCHTHYAVTIQVRALSALFLQTPPVACRVHEKTGRKLDAKKSKIRTHKLAGTKMLGFLWPDRRWKISECVLRML